VTTVIPGWLVLVGSIWFGSWCVVGVIAFFSPCPPPRVLIPLAFGWWPAYLKWLADGAPGGIWDEQTLWPPPPKKGRK
jgi:hypothetical protein